MRKHALHDLLRSPRAPLRVLLVGAGGNGSKLTVGLKNLHFALLALGHPGVQVTLADGDLVSESNLVRQSFYPSDVGLPKATVLVNRLNVSCGLGWEALPRHVTAEDVRDARIDLLLSCVDTRAARAGRGHEAERLGRLPRRPGQHARYRPGSARLPRRSRQPAQARPVEDRL